MQEDEYYARYLEHRYSPETAKSELVEITVEAKSPPEMAEVITSEGATQQAAPDKPYIHSKATTVRRAIEVPTLSTPTRLEINDLLPSYEDIVTALRKVDLEVDDTFGSTSDKPEVPQIFIVSLGNQADIAILQRVIEVAKNFGLDGIGRALQDYSANRIYIGGYGYRHRPYVRLTPHIVEQLLSPSLDWNGLRRIMRGSKETLVQPSGESSLGS